MSIAWPAACVVVLLIGCLTAMPVHAEHKVTVSSGGLIRNGTLVGVEIPGLGEGPWVLSQDGGRSGRQSQVGVDGRLYFTVLQQADETATYTLKREPNAGPTEGDMRRVTDAPGGLLHVLDSSGAPILHYRGEKGGMPADFDKAFLRGGYISAVFTPSGTLVTDDYPPDHKHHHAIWSPWTKTEFEGRKPDFWNMGQKTGTVEPVSFGKPRSAGHLFGGFRATHRMVDLSAPGGPKAAIDEQWDVSAYFDAPNGVNGPFYHVIDLVITQTCASDSPLVLPKYHYGGLGFRGHRQWYGETKCRFLTSEGKTRENGNETRAKWCHVGGDVDGKPAGVAILCHPDNFRFPQPVRLHPKEPFFCYAPSQLGDWRIEPGKPYVAKYRFIVSDGAPDAKVIEQQWRDYAEPVKVEVSGGS